MTKSEKKKIEAE